MHSCTHAAGGSGTWQQYMLVGEGCLAAVPDAVSDDAAAQVSVRAGWPEIVSAIPCLRAIAAALYTECRCAFVVSAPASALQAWINPVTTVSC